MIEKLKEQHETELASLQMSLNRMIMVNDEKKIFFLKIFIFYLLLYIFKIDNLLI